MHHRRSILMALVLAAALVISAVGVAVAQEDGFTETFDNAALPGWEKSQEAIVTGGTLQMSPGSFALHIGDWSEINLTVKVNYSGAGKAIINYYFREGGSYKLSLSTGHVLLEKVLNQTPSTLGQADVSAVQPGEWLNIKVVVSGRDHQVYVNDAQVLTATDPQPLETGAILLQAMEGTTVQFDDLDVRGTPGPGPGPAPDAGSQPAGAPLPVDQPAAPPADILATPTAPAVSQPSTGTGNLVTEFFASQASTIELTTFLVNLILASLLAYILGLVYVHWGTSLTNRRKFASNFLLMTVTTTFIIMVVRSSVALSLGLVGALSIVRFRTAIKEPEELAYLFFAIGIGIGLGDNQRLITLVAMVVGIILIGLHRIFGRREADVNLHLSVASRNPASVTLEQITETLRKHTAKMKLLRFDETAQVLEAAFMVEFRRMDQLNEARDALRSLSESLELTFMDNKGLW